MFLNKFDKTPSPCILDIDINRDFNFLQTEHVHCTYGFLFFVILAVKLISGVLFYMTNNKSFYINLYIILIHFSKNLIC